ncbi:MAG: NADH:ubiquinone oxidoreductase [Brevinematales bacterium]|jgi:Ni,Fe-hydrogenase III small subunit
MFKLLKSRFSHGFPYIRDIRKAQINSKFRGFPLIKKEPVAPAGAARCPSGALSAEKHEIDLGKCLLCGDCAENGKISFSSYYKTAATSRDALVIGEGESISDFEKLFVPMPGAISRLFGRSLKLRQVSAGGCGGCELELNACSNANFDMGRFGIEFTASPRHADGIVITGPVSGNMAAALEEAYNAVPDPRLIIAAGACAISGGIFQTSHETDRSFFDRHRVDLYIPGCPVHPLTFINGLMDLLRKRK